jgi:hypothetical protein
MADSLDQEEVEMCRKLICRPSIVLMFLTLLVFGCTPGLGRDNQPIAATPERDFSIGEIQVTIIDVSVRQSYSTYYLMNYPDPDEFFIVLELEIFGVEEPLEWAQSNLSLLADQGPYPLEISRPILIGEDIEYRADFDFEYHYELIYRVPRQVVMDELRMIHNGQAIAALAPLLETPVDELPGDVTGMVEPGGAALSGSDNLATGQQSVVAGGTDNQALAINSAVCGGSLNQATVSHAYVGGGRENRAELFYSTVGGGYGNLASARETTVCGGSRNEATNRYATIAGGLQNLASAPETTVAGGSYNAASEVYAAVVGGTQNQAAGYASFIGAGAGNSTTGDYAVVAGGLGNSMVGEYAFIGGGHANQALGDYTAVPGGQDNLVESDYSLALGSYIHILPEHTGAILVADSTQLLFTSEAANELAVRATGGVRLITAVDDDGLEISGAILPAGSGAWAQLSDRNAKADITSVDPQAILENLMQIPIQTWRYSSQSDSVRHIGPMAQDFHAVFGFGEDNRYINTIDADGVALASIQALATQVQDQAEQLAVLENQLESERGVRVSLVLMAGLFISGSIIGWQLNSRFLKKLHRVMVED